jgi:hypothetical protein
MSTADAAGAAFGGVAVAGVGVADGAFAPVVAVLTGVDVLLAVAGDGVAAAAGAGAGSAAAVDAAGADTAGADAVTDGATTERGGGPAASVFVAAPDAEPAVTFGATAVAGTETDRVCEAGKGNDGSAALVGLVSRSARAEAAGATRRGTGGGGGASPAIRLRSIGRLAFSCARGAAAAGTGGAGAAGAGTAAVRSGVSDVLSVSGASLRVGTAWSADDGSGTDTGSVRNAAVSTIRIAIETEAYRYVGSRVGRGISTLRTTGEECDRGRAAVTIAAVAAVLTGVGVIAVAVPAVAMSLAAKRGGATRVCATWAGSLPADCSRSNASSPSTSVR